MTSIISSEGIATATAPQVHNLSFWPAIDIGQFLALYRLSGTVTAERAAEALQQAVIITNRELTAWQAEQEGAGHIELAEVPGPYYGGEPFRAFHYRAAIYSLAKAALIATRLRDFDSTGKGHQQADQLEPGIDALRQQYREAIAAIQGKPRATVELI